MGKESYEGSYLFLVPVLLLSSQAEAQYDEPRGQHVDRAELESCMYLLSYRSIIEKSIEEFTDLSIAGLCHALTALNPLRALL
jgi:hypothetical protein